ncbi:LirA/MavJ family T4SS effector [Legionella parisiensis]|uniref:DUF5636 domain-containing protein n=1 Tax=Legionella parisiensis TaxID=45071 RepID=A0A1E5JV10_9GAMM|nr:LirA/MavJ family T4SS effector [Legionella parisiensis]KTD41157.1 helicase [Legionella parisiensis]OEH48372.1 hypothetical protein lpari_00628 [Legionella parisiensis]STX76544.1 helicase [Legionella parisiensis]
MTVELIQIGKKDTNNYEQCLQDFGYTNLDNKVQEDVIEVWKFFCNEELVLRGLKRFVTTYFLFNQEEKRSLRYFFDHWGNKNHFNNPTSSEVSEIFKTSTDFQYPRHTPILHGELTADLFNNVLLKNGYLAADAGAGPAHGKWAHTIQFFILEEARKEGVFQLHAQTVCQFIQTISQIKGMFESLSLWNILFDSFDEHIFTSPNNITKLLTSSWDSSEAAQFLAAKFNAYEEKFDRIAKDEKSYGGYTKQKYLRRLNEARYIFYKETCALLWFAPKNKEEKGNNKAVLETGCAFPLEV